MSDLTFCHDEVGLYPVPKITYSINPEILNVETGTFSTTPDVTVLPSHGEYRFVKTDIDDSDRQELLNKLVDERRMIKDKMINSLDYIVLETRYTYTLKQDEYIKKIYEELESHPHIQLAFIGNDSSYGSAGVACNEDGANLATIIGCTDTVGFTVSSYDDFSIVDTLIKRLDYCCIYDTSELKMKTIDGKKILVVTYSTESG